MKISIITPCLNSENTIKYTLNSVLTQDYKSIEHIIVDGGSTDYTHKILQEYKFKKKKIIIANKSKLYEAINIGIKNSTGEVITILNSDDIYQSSHTLKKVINFIKKNNTKVFFGDVVYFRNDNFFKISRYYSSKKFYRWMLKFGIMPPHTGSFIYKSVYDQFGLYDEYYKIAGDFEFFLRIIFKGNVRFKKINSITTRMKLGGISSKNFYSYIISSIEILRALKMNNIKSTIFHTFLRLPSKIGQLIFYNQKKLNYNFKFFAHKYYNNLFKNNFIIISKIKNLDNYKNYILSAMNLAFLGSYVTNQIHKYDNLINWPDGIFVKLFNKKIIKIPGRNILKRLKLKKTITKIKVFGHLTNKSRDYLQKRFNKTVENIPLPFGSIEEITKKKYLIKKNEVVFITLPTPKQEQFANHLTSNNKNYKIICIGGSIAIASGEEKVVPKKIYYLEFLWRLRYDTVRRFKRLTQTLLYYIYGKFIIRKINDMNISIV